MSEIIVASRNLKQHKITCTAVKTHRCELCPKSYMNGTTLNRHVKSHTGEKPFKCKLCEKSFIQNSYLKVHMRNHTGEKPYKCKLCHKSFSRSASLKTHMITHTGERPYKCQLCSKAFTSGDYLKRHVKIHIEEKPYKCQLCEKSYTESTYLKVHMRTHTGEKPYICQLCEKSFSKNCSLIIHMRTHTGEKPYICQLCEKSFSKNRYLIIHMRTHTGEKPYKCQLCSKSFTTRSNLKVHTRIHSGEKPYKCQLCGKSFTTCGTLKVHMRTHSRETRYKCKLCQQSFASVICLRSHTCMLTHTRQAPYLCEICNIRFPCIGSLKRHRRTHATDKQQTLHKSCYSLNLPRHHAGTEPRCLKLDNNSPALSGTAVIDKPNECPPKNMHPASGEENTPLSCISVKECQSMFITKPLEKSFGLGLCGEMLEIENEFEGHCPSHRLSTPVDSFNDMGRFCIHCKPSSISFAQQFKFYASTQPQCPNIENQSAACLSVPFTTLYGEGVIDEPTECLSMSMYPGSSENSSPLANIPVEEYLSIKSQEDGEPVLEKSFGCGICGEMLAIEKEFQEHCSSHRLSPPGDLCIDMCRFLIPNAWS